MAYRRILVRGHRLLLDRPPVVPVKAADRGQARLRAVPSGFFAGAGEVGVQPWEFQVLPLVYLSIRQSAWVPVPVADPEYRRR